ncbi:MAG: MFS transporter [Thermomicrobiales bacterium]|nr:MFS transporter [Thermomicrobiales bacterium]
MNSDRAARAWRPGPAFGLILGHFAMFGVVAGVRGVVWAELVDALRIGSGAFGSAQLVASFVSVAVVTVYARVAARIGPRSIAGVGLMLMVIALLWLAWAGSLAMLVVALAVFGASTGMLDGAMIQGSVDWERAAKRARMNVMHAGFSVGAVVGAIAAGLGLAAGADYPTLLIFAAALVAVTLAATAIIAYPPSGPAPSGSSGSWRPVLAAPGIGALIGIVVWSVVVESVAFVWAVIYLRDDLGASAAAGGASFALFNATMFAGRMLNSLLVVRLGARSSLLVSGAGIAVGGLLLVASSSVPLAMLALALAGLGVAGIFPTVMSESASRLPDHSRELTAVIMTVTYIAFMITPPAIGWIAELSSLRTAMLLLPTSGLVIIALAVRGLSGATNTITPSTRS